MQPNFFSQYADVIIPMIVSLITGIATFFVYKEKVCNLEKEVNLLRSEVKEIRDKVIACETSLKEREPLTKRKSPVDLTERGTKVLNESGGKTFIDNNYEELKRKVEDKTPKTSYDYQEASKEIVQTLKEDERINGIKEYLFKEGMEIQDIMDVLGLYLRNLILAEKNISTDDIDTTTPHTNAQI